MSNISVPKTLDGINIEDELNQKELIKLYKALIKYGSIKKMSITIGIKYWPLYNIMNNRTNSSITTRYSIRWKKELMRLRL